MAAGDVTLTTNANTQIVFRDSTDFSPAAGVDLRLGTPTAVQLDLTSVATSAYRQSTEVDLGANRAPQYAVEVAFEMAATPTAGNLIHLYWGPSAAGVNYGGGLGAADAAYTGYSSNADSAVRQLDQIGVFKCTVQVTGTVQTGFVALYSPPTRYGVLVVRNESGAAFHSDMVETHIVMTPVLPNVEQ